LWSRFEHGWLGNFDPAVCQIIDLCLGTVEIVDEPGNYGIHLMGVVSVAFHARKRMGLSGSSTDHVSAFPDRHPCSPYDPDRTSGILVYQAIERYGISVH
jgi:hypothetical protein